MINQITYISVPTFGGSASLTPPAGGVYSLGYTAGQVLPAENLNYFLNGLTGNENSSGTGINQIIVELGNLLAGASITPNPLDTSQVLAAVNARVNTLAVTPLNTHIANTQASSPGIHGAVSTATVSTLVARDSSAGIAVAALTATAITATSISVGTISNFAKIIDSDNTSAVKNQIYLQRGSGAGNGANFSTTGDAANGVASISLNIGGTNALTIDNAGKATTTNLSFTTLKLASANAAFDSTTFALVGGGSAVIIPPGAWIFSIAGSPPFIIQILNINTSTWVTAGTPGGSVISDGVHVRLLNTSGSPASTSALKWI